MTEMMTKEDVTAMILSAKKQAGMTWEDIADKIGMSPVWTHSACMGMNAFPPEKAKLLVVASWACRRRPKACWPKARPRSGNRPCRPTPASTASTRSSGVYGPTLKALIHEKFGDGIMSAIDFDMQVTRVEHPKGDRVKVEMSGKYLGYNSW